MLEKKDKKGLPVPMNSPLTAPAKKGSTSIMVKNAAQYHVNTLVLVGADNVKGNEIARIASIKGNTITFEHALKILIEAVNDLAEERHLPMAGPGFFMVKADKGSAEERHHTHGENIGGKNGKHHA